MGNYGMASGVAWGTALALVAVPTSWCAATVAWDSGDAGSPGSDNEDCP